MVGKLLFIGACGFYVLTGLMALQLMKVPLAMVLFLLAAGAALGAREERAVEREYERLDAYHAHGGGEPDEFQF